MTITRQDYYIEYEITSADAGRVEFPFSFPVKEASQIYCFDIENVAGGRMETPIPPSGYLVTAAPDGFPAGGKVTLVSPLSVGHILRIERITPLTQVKVFRNQRDIDPKEIEEALDLVVMAQQEEAEEGDGAVDPEVVAQLQEDVYSLEANKADKSDPRFIDARTPTAHKATHATGGSDAITPASIGAVATTDSRLSNARTPTAHKATHAKGGSDALSPSDIGAVADTDVRLTNARTPTAHKATHAKGGSDALSPSDIGAVADTDVRLTNARTPTAHAASHATGAADALTPANIGAMPTAPTDGKSYLGSGGSWVEYTGSGGGGDGPTSHTQLNDRDVVNQHPQAAITGLTESLAAKAPLASPAFTGAPIAPTASASSNSTRIATTEFVKNQNYAPLASPALTGTPTAPTPEAADSSTRVATTAFVKAQGYAASDDLADKADVNHSTPYATTSVAGHVMPSTGLSVTGSGVLTVSFGTSTNTACRGNDARFYAVIPVGGLLWHSATTAPTCFIAPSGDLISRATYAVLWAHAQSSGMLVTDDEWLAADGPIGCYSSGDGSTTFRLPRLGGQFLRAMVSGQTQDAGRVAGSWQGDTMRNLTGGFVPRMVSGFCYPDSISGCFTSGSPGNLVDISAYQSTGTFNRSLVMNAALQVPTGPENRPVNIAWPCFIRYQ